MGVNGSGKTTLKTHLAAFTTQPRAESSSMVTTSATSTWIAGTHQMSVVSVTHADYHFLVKDVIAMGQAQRQSCGGHGQKFTRPAAERRRRDSLAEWARQF